MVMVTACEAQKPSVAPPASAPVAVEAPKPPPVVPNTPGPEFPSETTLLAAQARFSWDMVDGKRVVKPGPARLVMLSPGEPAWRISLLEDIESNVFHKAICVGTAQGPRVLTLGGTEALLKLWHVEAGHWQAETLWNPHFGGKYDRLRDVEIGDVNGDGEPELVIATHDQGVIAVLTKKPAGGYAVTELNRSPETFVHEIELGDLDGNGIPEIYATPSKPNKANTSQSGEVVRFSWDSKKKRFNRTQAAAFGASHAKEILVAELDGQAPPELYAAVESERDAQGGETSPLKIVRVDPGGKRAFSLYTIATLPFAVQARVLLVADLTGRGKPEMLVSTMKGGVWRLIPTPNGEWGKELISKDLTGFENAAGVADMDKDGKPELYVSGDEQDVITRLVYNGTSFDRTDLYGMDKSDLTWNLLPCTPEAL